MSGRPSLGEEEGRKGRQGGGLTLGNNRQENWSSQTRKESSR
jgi:hypothetical protein